MKKPFPNTQQLDAMDCGPACLQMIANHYGRHYTLQTSRERSHITRAGVSISMKIFQNNTTYQKVMYICTLKNNRQWTIY
jgi:ABC-type bacteriocin/lantibiotic exporter with double-glycine peptidase domain